GNIYGEEKNVRTVTVNEALELLKIIGYPWEKAYDVKNKSQAIPSTNTTLDDQGVLGRMFGSKNGSVIQALYNGDISSHNNDDSSADMALCFHLAFWTGKNYQQMERLWLTSPLGTREKTQKRQDYRA